MAMATMAKGSQGEGRELDTHQVMVLEAEGEFPQSSLGPCGRELGESIFNVPPRAAWRRGVATVGR